MGYSDRNSLPSFNEKRKKPGGAFLVHEEKVALEAIIKSNQAESRFTCRTIISALIFWRIVVYTLYLRSSVSGRYVAGYRTIATTTAITANAIYRIVWLGSINLFSWG